MRGAPRRSFTSELKAEVVALVRQPGGTAGVVAREMELTETTVRAWVRPADLDDGLRSDGMTSEERAVFIDPRPSPARRAHDTKRPCSRVRPSSTWPDHGSRAYHVS
jgi:transposase